MNWSKLDSLVDALRCLPGVGAKTAQRMAYYLLQRDRPGAERLAVALTEAVNGIRHCERCNNFTEQPVCDLCASPRRNQALLAVVESPADLVVVEQTHSYNGLYFVLMGKLSPLDGVGPKDIHLDQLIKRAADNLVNEVIIATNFTVEGEATAHYIGESLRGRSVRISRIARGLPVGGELEHVDSGTIAQALVERREI